jgi:cytochrome P450
LRVALKDFTFSDGVRIPAGTFICLPLYAMHHDEQIYPDPFTFKPNRFVSSVQNMSEEAGRYRQQFVATGTNYLSWGVGRHAWCVLSHVFLIIISTNRFFHSPGRWFAATELKTMLAHAVVTYDVKLKDEGSRPPNQWFGTSCIPNRSAEVLFRKCQV